MDEDDQRRWLWAFYCSMITTTNEWMNEMNHSIVLVDYEWNWVEPWLEQSNKIGKRAREREGCGMIINLYTIFQKRDTTTSTTTKTNK